MSVRKRAINNRLARELQSEQEAHAQTGKHLAAKDKLLNELENKLKELQEEHRLVNNRLTRVLQLIAAHFTDPPRTLSRESELFELVKALAPNAVPPIAPRADEVLGAFLGMLKGESIQDLQAVISAVEWKTP